MFEKGSANEAVHLAELPGPWLLLSQLLSRSHPKQKSTKREKCIEQTGTEVRFVQSHHWLNFPDVL